MTIPNVIILARTAKWIVDYTEQNCRNTLIIPFNGIINDIVITKIALEAKNLCGLLNIYCLIGKEYESLYIKLFGNSNIKYELYDNLNLANFYLKAHDLASNTRGIVLGNIDKTTGYHCRIYSKLAEYTSDIFPIYDIKYSQILSIVKEYFSNLDNVKHLISQEECETIEWCLDADNFYGIITNNEVPEKNSRWPFLIQKQKTAVSRINRIEKFTRHKQINKPYFKIND